MGGECGELVAHTGENALPFCVDERLLEPAEADAAGQVADDREPQLGGDDEPVEHLAGSGVVWRRWCGLAEPALQERGRERDLGGGALLGQEHPEDRLLQVGSPVELRHAVVAQHASQLVPEGCR